MAKRPQPAVPTVMGSSGFGKEIMASRMNKVIAHPAHMGCSSRISLNDPICETVTFLPKGPCSTISRYSLGMNLSNPGENLTYSRLMRPPSFVRPERELGYSTVIRDLLLSFQGVKLDRTGAT